jgi:putative oxidoreductase
MHPPAPAEQARPRHLRRLGQTWLALNGGMDRALNRLQPLAALAARLFVAQVFWLSGLTKLRDWSSTLELFAYEYQVPLLPPPVAAVLGTAGELVLPVLLVLGLGGRVAALGLSVVNVVAVLSLPDMPEAALQLHLFWGSLLVGLAVHGPGRWSVEAWLGSWLSRQGANQPSPAEVPPAPEARGRYSQPTNPR